MYLACMYLAASSRSGKEKQRRGPLHTPKHIMHKEAEEKETPRRGDRCSCQTCCAQTQNARTLPSSVNDSTDSPTDSSDCSTDSTDSIDSATDSTDSLTDSTDHNTYWQFD